MDNPIKKIVFSFVERYDAYNYASFMNHVTRSSNFVVEEVENDRHTIDYVVVRIYR